MPRWEVRTGDRMVVVEGANWLLAVGTSATRLGLDREGLKRLVCDIADEGYVRIRDPKTGNRFTVRRVTAEKAESLSAPTAAPTPRLMDFDEDEPSDQDTDSESTLDDLLSELPPPSLTMPVPVLPAIDELSDSLLDDSLDDEQPLAPEDLVEQLFDLGMDISAAEDEQSAAALAIDILTKFVPAESAAVLLVDDTRDALRFAAATGPFAEQARTLVVPMGEGIAGYCVGSGHSVVIQNAADDPRHFSEADQKTGYRTKGLLAAVLVDSDQGVHGCIELINPPGRFLDWHLDAACSIASALAENLGARMRGAPPAQ